MSQVLLTPRAQEDLEEILTYLETQSSQATDRFVSRFDERTQLHAAHPLIGAPSEEYAPDLRHFTVWNYAVFYRPLQDGIEIIRIIHGARDMPNIFG
jgi:toxin ParE1/3/4